MLSLIFSRPFVLGAAFTSIEAAHFYTQDHPDRDAIRESVAGAEIAKQTLIPILTDIYGIHPDTVVFIDDYNVEPNAQSYEYENLEKLASLGYHPDTIIYESSLAEQALQLLSQLKALEAKEGSSILKTVTKKGKKDLGTQFLLTETGGTIKLTKCDAGIFKPTCALLDAVCYINKLNSHSEKTVFVTVLPDTWYQKQQYDTQYLLKLLNIPINIVNVYFDQDGNLTFNAFYNGI